MNDRVGGVPGVIDASHPYRPAAHVQHHDGRRSERGHVDTAQRLGNPVGNVHGGYITLLVDDTAGMALLSVIGTGAPTVSLQVDYLHGMPLGRSTSPAARWCASARRPPSSTCTCTTPTT